MTFRRLTVRPTCDVLVNPIVKPIAQQYLTDRGGPIDKLDSGSRLPLLLYACKGPVYGGLFEKYLPSIPGAYRFSPPGGPGVDDSLRVLALRPDSWDLERERPEPACRCGPATLITATGDRGGLPSTCYVL